MKETGILLFLIFFSLVTGLTTHGKPGFWGDEILGGVNFLDAPSIVDFLFTQWSIGPEVAPGYPTLMYVFNSLFPGNVEYFRYVSFIVSIFCTISMYLLLSKITSPHIAVLTAISVTLLPMHLWYSWLLRPHIFAFALSICSLILFLIWLERKDTVIFLSMLISNWLLILTHYMFFWIPLAEAIYLCTLRRMHRTCWFFLVNTAILTLFLVFYLTIFIQVNNIGFLPERDLVKLFLIIFGLCDFEVPSYSSWSIFLPKWISVYGWLTPKWNFLLSWGPRVIQEGGNIVLSLLLIYIMSKQIMDFWKRKRIGPSYVNFITFVSLGFPLLFGILQWLTGLNLLMPRYFYIAFAGKVFLLYHYLFTLHRKSIKGILCVLLLFYFIHQYMLYRVSQPYTDWNSCIRHISEKIDREDIIIIGRWEEGCTLKSNWKNLPKNMFYPISFYSVFNAIEHFKSQFPDRNLWVIASMQWNSELPCIYREELSQRGIFAEEKIFPAFEGLVCYRIPKSTGNASNIQFHSVDQWEKSYFCPEPISWKEEKQRQRTERMRELGLSYEIQKEEVSLLELLLFPDGTAGISTFPLLTFYLYDMGKIDWIQSLINRLASEIVWANVSGMLIDLENNNYAEAEKKFNNLKRQNFFLHKIMKPVYEAYRKGDEEKIRAEAKRLKKMGFPLGWFIDNRYLNKNLPSEVFLFTMD